MSDEILQSETRALEQRTLITGRTIGLITAALLLFGAIALISDTFLSSYTMFVLSRQIAFFTLIALAQAVCLVVGGMNLSVGAIGSICTVVLGLSLAREAVEWRTIWPLGLVYAVPVAILGALAGLRGLERTRIGRLWRIVLPALLGIAVFVAVSVLFAALLARGGMSGTLAVILALGCGLAVGLTNGLLIVKLKINSFIVTLSTMFVFMGLRSGVSGGQPYPIPQSFWFIGQEGLGPEGGFRVPYVFIIMLIVLWVLSYMYRNTVFGRRMLATGGNADAARLSGISNDNMIIGANMLSGALAALAAVLWASELGSAAPESGDAWLIVTFAVAIIGGTGLNGGAISPYGILMGGIIYTLIRHGLIEMKANPYYMNVYIGVLILLTIAIDRIREVYSERHTG